MTNRFRFLAVFITLASIASASAAPASSSDKIDIEARGSLREVLRQVAEKGGLNVVVTGSLDEPAEVYLHDVSGAEALETLARVHDLKIEKKGKTWIIRSSAAPAPARPEAPERPTQAERPSDETPVAPAMPVMPVAPTAPPSPGHKRDRVTMGRLHVAEGETVTSAVSFGGPIIVDGHVEQDVVAIGGLVQLNPTAVVDGSVVSMGAKVERAPGSKVGRDEVSMGVHGFNVSEADETRGSTLEHHEEQEHHESSSMKHAAASDEADESAESEDGFGSAVTRFLVRFLVLFGIGALGFLGFPNAMKSLSTELTSSLPMSALVGLLAVLASIPLTILLCITLIGIPVALVLVSAFMIAWLVGLTVIAREIGSRLPRVKTSRSEALVLAAGLAVMLTFFALPVVGWVFIIAAFFIGIGSAVLTVTRGRNRMTAMTMPSAQTRL